MGHWTGADYCWLIVAVAFGLSLLSVSLSLSYAIFKQMTGDDDDN